MKVKFLFLILVLSASLFANKPRLYQFITGNEGESYFIPELVNISNIENNVSIVQPGVILSLYSKGVELSGGMFYFEKPEFTLSSDLYYGFFKITDGIKLDMGLGGALLFSSSIDDGFYSDIMLRFPFRFKYDDYFIKLNPMAGISMFEIEPVLRFSIGISFGYMFDFYSPEVEKELKPEKIE